jgi:hypothetical protein
MNVKDRTMKRSLHIYLLLICQSIPLLILLLSCRPIDPQQKETHPIQHDLWSEVLKEFVNDAGEVNYAALKIQPQKLLAYLELLAKNIPNDQYWNSSEKLAYWINLYNAFTLKLIIDYYPVKGIKDIGTAIQIPFINTPWDIKLINLGNEKLSLNQVEHEILRSQFKEPRIHFAINCASISCPKLRRDAYRADRLEQQLSEQAYLFLNDPSKNKISSDTLQFSKIFDWFSKDFINDKTFYENLSVWSGKIIPPDVTPTFLDYNWSLNEQL